MFRSFCILGASAVLLAACQTTPKQTVLDLDTTDPLWVTDACIQARKEVHGYDDKEGVRAAAGVAGTVAGGPIAGATAGLALNALQDGKRGELNEEVKAACVSPPGTKAPTFAANEPAPPPPSLGAPVATPSDTAALAEPAPLAVPDAATPASATEPQN